MVVCFIIQQVDTWHMANMTLSCLLFLPSFLVVFHGYLYEAQEFPTASSCLFLALFMERWERMFCFSCRILDWGGSVTGGGHGGHHVFGDQIGKHIVNAHT